MSRRYISLILFSILCIVCFVGVWLLIKEDVPLYAWVPFETTSRAEDTNNVTLILEGDTNIPMGFHEFQLTLTNNSSYTLVVSPKDIGIQKFEGSSWCSIQPTSPKQAQDANGLGTAEGILPSGSCTYNLLLSDLFPPSLQSPGEYRIFVPFYFRLNEQDLSNTLESFASIPITITGN